MTHPITDSVRSQGERIRQYGSKWVVTHKCVRGGLTEEGPHESRVETETLVEDGPVMGKIFEALGFGPVFRL